MTLQQLTYFCAVCRYHSIVRAAKALYISQPTISTAIHELERKFLEHQAQLPLQYVMRPDYIRNQSVIEAKLDALAERTSTLIAMQRDRNAN